MANKDKVMNKIETLRQNLLSLIQVKGELLDPEVIQASILLDNALNAYNMLILKGSEPARDRKIS
jgi:hypothetical protein